MSAAQSTDALFERDGSARVGNADPAMRVAATGVGSEWHCDGGQRFAVPPTAMHCHQVRNSTTLAGDGGSGVIATSRYDASRAIAARSEAV